MDERIIEYFVTDEVGEVRADKLFASVIEDVSRARLQKAFDSGRVSFEGEVIDKRYKIRHSGWLRATLERVSIDQVPQGISIPLDVVYEDDAIIVINKSSGMVTHPGNGTGEDTLVHALLYHCKNALSTVGMPERPGIVHRLDKETSGLIVVAKTDLAHHALAKDFSERTIKKRYLALVSGVPKVRSGTCMESIGRHPTYRTKMSVQSKGREAHTDWKVLETLGEKASLVECAIHTGRTHQIRVHMQNLGFPLLGDQLYGFHYNRFKDVSIDRIFLHATYLSFTHPASGKSLEFSLPLPKDFSDLMAVLKEKFSSERSTNE
jgi:23S rRNA pseudouridine1911/1915/1917 synthase